MGGWPARSAVIRACANRGDVPPEKLEDFAFLKVHLCNLVHTFWLNLEKIYSEVMVLMIHTMCVTLRCPIILRVFYQTCQIKWMVKKLMILNSNGIKVRIVARSAEKNWNFIVKIAKCEDNFNKKSMLAQESGRCQHWGDICIVHPPGKILGEIYRLHPLGSTPRWSGIICGSMIWTGGVWGGKCPPQIRSW